MRKFAQHDEEDDQTGDPRPGLVLVHHLVAEDGDEPCRRCDYNDTSVARDVVIHGVDQLGAYYDIHGGPAHTSEDIKACNCGMVLVPGLRGGKEAEGERRRFTGGGST